MNITYLVEDTDQSGGVRVQLALFAPEDNAVELGEKLIEVLSDYEVRERLRERGRKVAEQWRVQHVADRLEEFFRSRGK
jgi:glycosyltransferase involved in cell wall biosynthesis